MIVGFKMIVEFSNNASLVHLFVASELLGKTQKVISFGFLDSFSSRMQYLVQLYEEAYFSHNFAEGANNGKSFSWRFGLGWIYLVLLSR